VKIVCKHRPNRHENARRTERMFAKLVLAAKVFFLLLFLFLFSSFSFSFFHPSRSPLVQETKETFDDVSVDAMVALTRKPKGKKLVYPDSWKIHKKPMQATV